MIVVQRDYVTKKSRRKKNSSDAASGLMKILAIILVVLFGAILYFVATNHSSKPVDKPKTKTEAPAFTLPEQPQERWTYLKELEKPNSSSNQTSTPSNSSTVSERQQILDSFVNNTNAVKPSPTQTQNTLPKTAVPNNMPQSANRWILQCGAFKDKSNADTLRAKLAMSGVNGSIINGQLYRVVAGPYDKRNDADQTVSALKNSGITNCIVSTK